MAQTTYTSDQTVTLGNRAAAYTHLAALLMHLDGFNINMLSCTFDSGTHLVTIVLSDALPPGQAAHLNVV